MHCLQPHGKYLPDGGDDRSSAARTRDQRGHPVPLRYAGPGQFEREVTGERIRDKFAASKRKGIWVGGNVPLGYESRDKKPVIHEEEAERVRMIFRRYLELGSIGPLLSDLRRRGTISPR
jgi:hypothetical protein